MLLMFINEHAIYTIQKAAIGSSTIPNIGKLIRRERVMMCTSSDLAGQHLSAVTIIDLQTFLFSVRHNQD
jgi:hypothetical protein